MAMKEYAETCDLVGGIEESSMAIERMLGDRA
jgi:hypothetical protein